MNQVRAQSSFSPVSLLFCPFGLVVSLKLYNQFNKYSLSAFYADNTKVLGTERYVEHNPYPYGDYSLLGERDN